MQLYSDLIKRLQAGHAYQFVLRHISQGITDYTGVYRNDRWEYPIIAIREVIRNAVIHRDYSLTGKDIKIAIFDGSFTILIPTFLGQPPKNSLCSYRISFLMTTRIPTGTNCLQRFVSW